MIFMTATLSRNPQQQRGDNVKQPFPSDTPIITKLLFSRIKLAVFTDKTYRFVRENYKLSQRMT